MELLQNNILILQSNYIDILKDIQYIPKTLPKVSNVENLDLSSFKYPLNGRLTNPIKEMGKVKLNPRCELKIGRKILAYDESIVKFSCLEGEGYLTAHSLVYLEENDYIPKGLLSFYFYTRSKLLTNQSKFIKYSIDPEMDSKRDYILDRIEFLSKNTPPGSIILIDGPLIGGDVYTYMINAIDEFLEKNIIPVFFVKNSTSNMVSDSIAEIQNKYNSDMHWTYSYLNKGERTNYFYYADINNVKNSKVFCYLKAFDKSPQRIEFHTKTYEKYHDELDNILDKIYYFLLVQGDHNPQVRPIAIAEKFAREFIDVSDMKRYFFGLGLTPTMNMERFGR